jgi:hypothetical protein
MTDHRVSDTSTAPAPTIHGSQQTAFGWYETASEPGGSPRRDHTRAIVPITILRRLSP